MQLAQTTLKVMAFLSCLILLIPFSNLGAQEYAQDFTIGLLQYGPESFDGYTLFSPMGITSTYLIDNYGRLVHSWESDYPPNNSVYLRENGNLLRAVKIPSGGEFTGGIQEFAWDGTLVWDFPFNGIGYEQHHDIEPLPNGNVLILAREDLSYAEAITLGRDPALLDDGMLSPEFIVEVEQTGPNSGNVVWEWHLKDHLIQDFDSSKNNYDIIGDHPELVDINYTLNGRADWLHANSVAYNPELDQIAISCRHINEFWIIDHSTTTMEAAGHTGGQSGRGGDILYRWGNPQVYDAGNAGDQKLYAQHDVHWIKPGYPGEGNILIFNNGANRPGGKFSTVEEIVPPVDHDGHYEQPTPGNAYGPATPTWSYQADPPTGFYSDHISGARRLENGNTLICSGAKGRFFEVTPVGDMVWHYINPVSTYGILHQGDPIPSGGIDVFRCIRYSSDYEGLQGRDLTPGGVIELYPISIADVNHSPQLPTVGDSVRFMANITSDNEIISAKLNIDTGSGYYSIDMYDDGTHYDSLAGDGIYGAAISPLPELTEVSYYVEVADDLGSVVNDPTIAPDATYGYVTGPAVYLCGDANGDETVNVSDAVSVINYVFMGGSPPDPIESGDTNCDYTCNVSDAVYIINYVFVGGNTPCDTNGDGNPDC